MTLLLGWWTTAPPFTFHALIPRKSTIFRVGINGVPGARDCMKEREAICGSLNG